MQVNSAVIFAGGQSRRMGKDKALLPFGAYDTMAEYQYRKLEKLFPSVYISAKSNKFDFDLKLISDSYSISSPMVALASVLEKLDNSAVFVLSVDMPLVDDKVIDTLLKKYQEVEQKPDILIAKSDKGMEPLCAIYSQSVLSMAKELLDSGIHRMHTLMEKAHVETVFFEDADKFSNLNTQQEYEVSIRL
ncbi:MAG TPA: molybdenum cofactor guanylyltransferase [Sulfurovum sp.]|nr:molybdenum cofactor guanylyltransferase [Sulfurovum sp.]